MESAGTTALYVELGDKSIILPLPFLKMSYLFICFCS